MLEILIHVHLQAKAVFQMFKKNINYKEILERKKIALNNNSYT